MPPATHDDEDEDVWDRITDVLEPLAEAVDPESPHDGDDEAAPERQRK